MKTFRRLRYAPRGAQIPQNSHCISPWPKSRKKNSEILAQGKRSHARHRKVRQTPGRRARPPFTRAGRAVVRVREVRLEVVKADREDRARHGRGWGAKAREVRGQCGVKTLNTAAAGRGDNMARAALAMAAQAMAADYPPPFAGQLRPPTTDDASRIETVEEPQRDDPSIFLGNLPFNITDAVLTELLQQFGPLEGAARVLRDATGRSRGIAFADYRDMDSACYAVHVINGLLLDGRQVRANLAGAERGAPLPPLPPAHLDFVGPPHRWRNERHNDRSPRGRGWSPFGGRAGRGGSRSPSPQPRERRRDRSVSKGRSVSPGGAHRGRFSRGRSRSYSYSRSRSPRRRSSRSRSRSCSRGRQRGPRGPVPFVNSRYDDGYSYGVDGRSGQHVGAAVGHNRPSSFGGGAAPIETHGAAGQPSSYYETSRSYHRPPPGAGAMAGSAMPRPPRGYTFPNPYGDYEAQREAAAPTRAPWRRQSY